MEAAGWRVLLLGDGQTAPAEMALLAQQFNRSALAGHTGAAIFTQHRSDGQLHCGVYAYFSPAAAELACQLEAKPCTAPEIAAVDWLCGQPDGDSSGQLPATLQTHKAGQHHQ